MEDHEHVHATPTHTRTHTHTHTHTHKQAGMWRRTQSVLAHKAAGSFRCDAVSASIAAEGASVVRAMHRMCCQLATHAAREMTVDVSQATIRQHAHWRVKREVSTHAASLHAGTVRT